MAKLRIQAPNGKTLVVDVTGHEPSEYDALATAAVSDYMGSQAMPDDVRNEPGLEDASVSTVKALGTMTKAGISGLADIANPEQAKQNVENVLAGEKPETTEGKVGEFVGSLVTPAQIALQGGLGKFLEASGLGEWATSLLQSWSEKAALAAVGYTKAIGKAIGLDNLSGLAQFLMQPVEIGGKELPAIVTATNDAPAMLKAAEAIKDAAGAQLGVVSDAVDAAIKNATEKGAEAPVAIDLAGLQKNIADLKAAVEEVAPNLGKAVVNQYESAIQDLNGLVKDAIEGDSKTIFSDLSKLKTTIGDLVYKHGSPLESKAALNDVYHAISSTLDQAASKVGGTTGAAYAQANAVYHKAVAVVNALEGKALGGAAKGFFSDLSAMGTGMLAGFVNPVLAIPTAIGTHVARNYGPQAIAQGLDASAPLLGSALRGAVRAMPVVGNAISAGLMDNQ